MKPPDAGQDVPRDNLRGGAWLIADMALNIWALSIVKWLGTDYGAAQVVFLRALVGLAVIAPLLWRDRDAFRALPDLPMHLLRVTLAAITLLASFFAIARIPLATFTALSFTRPVLTMIMATTLLRETVSARQWIAAGVALAGVLIAVNPSAVPWSWGLAAMALMIVSGSATVITTRRLRSAPVIVLMAFYTAGLTLCSAPLALATWVPIQQGHLLPLLAIGCFAQVAQMCFLRAHFHGTAGLLSVLSYLSLVLSVAVGYLVFGEEPGLSFGIGAALVVAAALWTSADLRSLRLRS